MEKTIEDFRKVKITRGFETWVIYAILAYYSYFLSILGPILPLLRSEMDLSYTLTSLHSSLFAAGMVLCGFLSDSILIKNTRRSVLFYGVLGLAVFALLFSLSPNIYVSLPSSFGMGFLGTLILVTVQVLFSDRPQQLRDQGIAESNVGASLTALIAPLVVGFFSHIQLTWRPALWIGILFFVCIGLLLMSTPKLGNYRSQNQTKETNRETSRDHSLSKAYWFHWIMIFFSVAIEFSILYWAASFLIEIAGLTESLSAALLSSFLAAMLLGRFIGSKLIQKTSRYLLLGISLMVVTLGFLFYWLGNTPFFIITGLSICGLGVANLYPLLVSSAIASSPSSPELANSKIILASASAILIAPLILGFLSDLLSIRWAYGIVLIFIGIVALFLGLVARTVHSNRSDPT